MRGNLAQSNNWICIYTESQNYESHELTQVNAIKENKNPIIFSH